MTGFSNLSNELLLVIWNFAEVEDVYNFSTVSKRVCLLFCEALRASTASSPRDSLSIRAQLSTLHCWRWVDGWTNGIVKSEIPGGGCLSVTWSSSSKLPETISLFQRQSFKGKGSQQSTKATKNLRSRFCYCYSRTFAKSNFAPCTRYVFSLKKP